MQQALIQKRKSGGSLLDILQAITGHPLPPDFVNKYKKDHLFNLKILHGIDVFDPDNYTFDWQEVKELIQTILPLEICRQHKLFPLKKRNHQPQSLVVAMVNPRDSQALNSLKEILRPQQMKLARKVITQQDFNHLIEQYIREQHPQDVTQVGDQDLETLVGITDIFEDVSPNLGLSLEKPEDDLSLLNDQEANPVITLVNNILVKALENKASEISIDPQENYLIVSFRQDGILAPAFDPIPKEIASAVIARLRLLSKLNIHHHQPNTTQKGRMRKTFGGRKIDFWVSILPDRYGEKVSLRIIDPKAISLDLEALVTQNQTRELIQNLLSCSTGLLLVTGSNGSGISTTVAALLTQRNQLGVNIATVEDPIERTLPNINQVEVSEELGRDYDSVLQSFLNQNIDVIGVDQIRGRNVAKTIVDAAVSHLVITCLSTTDAASAIVRLLKIGVDSSSLAENLIGVVNQRLVRRLCPVCRLSYQPTASELEKLGLSSLVKRQISCYKANALNSEEIEQARGKGRLCRQCNGKGYQGQIGIYEVMGISPCLKTLILQEEEAETIKEAAIQEGMKTLLAYGLELVLEGKTTLTELERVLADCLRSSGSAAKSQKGYVSPQLLKRLQEMEKILIAFTQEFKQLKEDLELSTRTATEWDKQIVYEELKDPQEWDKIKAQLEPDKATIISNTPVYEELTDPGEWEELKKDFDPDKETIVSQSDLEEDVPDFQINTSFRSVPDPWSNS
jgi:type IV pilus assembly protein PilB